MRYVTPVAGVGLLSLRDFERGRTDYRGLSDARQKPTLRPAPMMTSRQAESMPHGRSNLAAKGSLIFQMQKRVDLSPLHFT